MTGVRAHPHAAAGRAALRGCTVTGIDEQLVLRDLPFDQPMVHVDAIWHRRAQHGHAHEWLRTALLRSAAAAFADSVLGQKVPG